MSNALGISSTFARRIASIGFVGALAATSLAFQTQTVAYQDIPGLVGKKAENRWLMHIKQPTGESVANIVIDTETASKTDPTITSTVSARLMVSETIKPQRTAETVNRAIKGNRVVETTARQAPREFTAGSVLERHSLLEPLDAGKKFALEFLKPKPSQEAIQLATLFHPKQKQARDALENLPVAVASLVQESESSILAYSPEPKVEYSPFAAVLKEEQPVKIVPKLNKGDHAWAADPLPMNSFSKKQQRCLAQGIYFEARGEPVRGQAAVSQVILNRVRNPHYPNTICGVVYQNKHWYNRCQFSFACDRIRDKIRNKKLYEIAKHVAAETTSGRIWLPQVGSSTHYHATYVNPRWNRRMKRVGRIGLHVFYRTFNGGWS